ncbi:MAG: helix-turn-helix domain-containing protein [Cupriavidus necator]
MKNARPSKAESSAVEQRQSTAPSRRQPHTAKPADSSAEAQRARLLRALKRGPVDTVHAYRHLDILHAPRRVFELRHAGYIIVTSWVWRHTEQGVRHRVGVYSLEVPA